MDNREIYAPMTSSEMEKQMMAIVDSWKTFFAGIKESTEGKIAFENSRYFVNSKALNELVKRVHQRKDYFTRYHSGLNMSEFKEIGLNMFWLSKLKPFSVEGEKNIDAHTFDLNEDFAVYHMLNCLEAMAKRLNLKYDEKRVSQSLYYEMSYCLSFRDMSKEAMGILVELVARVVIPDYYLKDEELGQ